jgi:hypothetical protein
LVSNIMIADGRDGRLLKSMYLTMITIKVHNILHILLCGRGTSNKVVRFPFSDDGPFDFLKKHIPPITPDRQQHNISIYRWPSGPRRRRPTKARHRPAGRLTHAYTMEVYYILHLCMCVRVRRQEDNRFIFNQPLRLALGTVGV